MRPTKPLKIAIRIYDTIDNRYVERDGDFLMVISGLDKRLKFDGVAVQSDGRSIVCDKAGNYSVLSEDRFNTTIMFSCN